MVLPMPKAMFKMIALGFKDIVVFIFCLPPCPTCCDNGRNRLGVEQMSSHKCIVVKHLSIRLSGNG